MSKIIKPRLGAYPSPSAWSEQINRRQVLAGGVALGAAGLLVACGSDDEPAAPAAAAPAAAAATAVPAPTGATGTVTLGSNASDDDPKAAIVAAVAALPNKNITVNVNTTDHNTFQENINAILQAGEDDVLTWFAGFRNKFFADQELLSDISDVWANVEGLGAGFKAASTASDGKQYFMPVTYYTWAVNYSKALWAEKGYSEPANLDELLSLADDMASDGITPFAYANDGQWPIMGTFDVLNMRVNGYDFHVDLMGGSETWTDERVKNVFTTWETLLPYHQEGANGRTWQEAAAAIETGEAGMFLLGTFAASASDALAADMDFFNFPETDSAIGAGALDAPIDGFQLISDPSNEEAAKELLLHFSTPLAQNAYLSADPSVVASNSGTDTTTYNDLQKKSAQLAGAATGISQFLDRDTIPDFAGECGNAFAEFIEDPSKIDSLLSELQDKKVAIFADYS